LSAVGFGVALFASTEAHAQEDLQRSNAWNTATNVLAISAGAVEVIMPRIFYSDPEVTVGWKARWHVSVLAPAMTLTSIALFNEVVLKDAIEGSRPGCDETTKYYPECRTYGFMSTPSFGAFSAFGHGTGVFLADTLKWSHGEFNVGSLFGHMGIPLVLGVITTVGRGAGNLETAGQAWASAGVGTIAGLGMGLLYGLSQRPECGYSGSLICW
jgi:hypothetical protein